MAKSIYKALILFVALLAFLILTACASYNGSNQYAEKDCEALGALFRNYDLTSSVSGASLANGISVSERSKDKFTFPWGDGGSAEEKFSKTRAKLRKAHKQQGCAS